MTTNPLAHDERVLILERTFEAAPARVFAAFTAADIMRKWMGPEGITCPEGEVDFREGGAWSILMKNSTGETHHVSGVFTEIKPDEQIAFSWAWTQEDGSRGHETIVSIVLRATDTGATALTMVQAQFQDEETRNNHEHGWAGSFDKLTRRVDAVSKMR